MQHSRHTFLRQAAVVGGAMSLISKRMRAQGDGRRVCGWTAGEIRAGLGISAAVYLRVRLGEKEIAAIREAGLTRIELVLVPRMFDFRDRPQREEVLSACGKNGVRIVSAHADLGLKLESEDRAERGAAGRTVIDLGGCLLFEDGRGEDPVEWTRMAAAFPESFVRTYE